MKRRSFVKTSLLTACVGGVSTLISQAASGFYKQKKSGHEFYELRVYHLKNDAQQKLVEDYFRTAAIPALNKLGIKNIGVFTEHKPKDHGNVYVVIPFNSIDDLLKAEEKLANDTTYRNAADAYLNAPAAEPAYERIESSLLKAFDGMHKLEIPPKTARLFELRRYESAGESAGKKKIEMFNKMGEIKIFKRVGLTPVFFGESLIGEMRPNLTYMLTYDDMAEHDLNWKKFSADPEWLKIKAIPEFADKKIVSRITSTFLVPTSFSQV